MMRRFLYFTLSVILILCPLFVKSPAALQSRTASRSVSEYDLPFGPNPFAPSRATSDFPGFLDQAEFPPASYCASCHREVHREWRESAHANSFREPFYLKNVQLLIDQKGIAYSRHCEGCHNPVALFSGVLTTGSKAARPFDEEGVTCSVCHSITRLEGTSGTGSYVMGYPAVMLNPDGTPLQGLPTFSEILSNPERHKKAVMRELLKTPEFCSACHKAAIPAELNGYKWLRAFSVYDEWQQSSWSRQSALPFYQKDKVSTCQDCHMQPSAANSDHTSHNGTIPSHRFASANTAIPAYYSYPDQLQAVRDRLRDSLAVDFFRATIEHQGCSSEISPLGSNAFRVRPGDWITIDLVIQNRNIGHSLVPEQRDFYESWVEFKATNSNTNLLHSGALDSNGMLDPSAHSYMNRLIDSTGKLLNLHQVWNTRLKSYDNTIGSGRSDLVRYRFQVPAGAHGSIEMTAAVRYRRFRKQYSDFILETSSFYPVFDLGSASLSLAIGKNASRPELDPHKLLLRWNNYGVALLGQQQWIEAANAFAETAKIDPKYVDGYVNQAIAEYSRWIESKKEGPDGPGIFSLNNANASPEKFATALRLLDQALALRPGYARAMFYKGVIQRLQNNLGPAAEQLKEVVRQYPQMRQGHQELGYVFYLQKDYSQARDEFEAAKRLNPDDVTACYYLSIVYAYLRNDSEARINAQLYSQHRDDPNNYGLNIDFVRQHVDEARELTPYHVHNK
ncbi:MAG TPA: tetratricopeptide repeat protein [Candidatus Angelobacter sp.]|nr:tetratricopeptide repeat protein [Candidatus Angelobacter sp.]